jgi:hypothetical protein
MSVSTDIARPAVPRVRRPLTTFFEVVNLGIRGRRFTPIPCLTHQRKKREVILE